MKALTMVFVAGCVLLALGHWSDLASTIGAILMVVSGIAMLIKREI